MARAAWGYSAVGAAIRLPSLKGWGGAAGKKGLFSGVERRKECTWRPIGNAKHPPLWVGEVGGGRKLGGT